MLLLARKPLINGAQYHSMQGERNEKKQGKGFFLSIPSIYEPAYAQNRAHADSTCWATLNTVQLSFP
jgi:hypothetical protein